MNLPGRYLLLIHFGAAGGYQIDLVANRQATPVTNPDTLPEIVNYLAAWPDLPIACSPPRAAELLEFGFPPDRIIELQNIPPLRPAPVQKTPNESYQRGYTAGFEHAAHASARTHARECEHLTRDLAWALAHLEHHDIPPDITQQIAQLRTTWRLDRGSNRKTPRRRVPTADMD